MKTKSWAEMTEAERRIAVARDVLKQLASGVVKPTSMVYLQFPSSAVCRPLCDLVQAGVTDCRACAKGAMILSAARLGDAEGVEVYGRNVNSDQMERVLAGIFGHEQADRIEAAYEGWSDGSGASTKSTQAWVKRYPDATKRMRAIFRNIVRNGGWFRASKP